MAKITQAKAKKILADGKLNGKSITAKQRKFFKLIAAGLFSKGKKKK